MRIVCKEQKTVEWFEARLGKITASRIADATAFLKRASKGKTAGESSETREKYKRQLALELVTRVPAEHYVSPAMEVGSQYEGEARVEYWMKTGNEVDQTGFVLHPTLDYLGASPDGLVSGGGVEIKVPLLQTHWGYLEADCVPEEYIPQMQCNMLCCERPWWDFVSYCPPEVYPELPDRFRLFIKRLDADPAMHRLMEEAAERTMMEVVELVQSLSERFPESARHGKAKDLGPTDMGLGLTDEELDVIWPGK